VVEYDDVMNKQREIIYKRRHKVLELARQLEEQKNEQAEIKEGATESLKDKIIANLEADIANIVTIHAPEEFSQIEYEQIVREYAEIVPFDLTSQKQLQADLEKIQKPEQIITNLQDLLHRIYDSREQELGTAIMRQIELFVTLRTIDKLWMEHLSSIDDLRDGIGLRGYGQRDPLVEYKNEAFGMFERLLTNIDYEIGRQIFRVGVVQQPAIPTEMITSHPEASQAGQEAAPLQPVQKTVKHSTKKIGRNDPCWCGSGKKWKKCHYPQTA